MTEHAGSPAAELHLQDLFNSAPRQRIPKIIVAPDGTVLAFKQGCRLLRRSEDAGRTWSAVAALDIGGANAIVDDTTGHVLLVKPSESKLLRSTDNGRTWQAETIEVRPNGWGHGAPGQCPANVGASESGVTLRQGEHAGRLLMPVRIMAPDNSNDQEHWPYHYNTSIYSDDGGATWQTGEPVQSGTGEGTLAELSDGRVYYNSRCHLAVDARRRIAWSHDGGHRWVDWQVCDTLREVGEPFYFKYGSAPSYGCNAGLVRLPDEVTGGKDILLYSAPDNPGSTRVRMTVWASFDEARTWPLKRLVYAGPSAYSSLAADTKGTVYLLFERGRSANPRRDVDHHRITLARFTIDWVLAGGPSESVIE